MSCGYGSHNARIQSSIQYCIKKQYSILIMLISVQPWDKNLIGDLFKLITVCIFNSIECRYCTVLKQVVVKGIDTFGIKSIV